MPNCAATSTGDLRGVSLFAIAAPILSRSLFSGESVISKASKIFDENPPEKNHGGDYAEYYPGQD